MTTEMSRRKRGPQELLPVFTEPAVEGEPETFLADCLDFFPEVDDAEWVVRLLERRIDRELDPNHGVGKVLLDNRNLRGSKSFEEVCLAFPVHGHCSVQKHLQLQRNKVLKSDVFRYINWLRTFAAGHQLYVGLDDESKPSPAAKPVEAPRGGKPRMPRRDSGQEDAAKNNGRVGGKAETIVRKNAKPPARKAA
ncbi:hypothetical protein DYB37_013699 [Aphanomyces astaci]|uniref:Uncharacterized protein n=1 Tax=Aphanomyces astaci TaxID=112090 RepID=A0A3R7A4Q6_APHAT|nr:hypothetical protein DYB37_013699 [Aphanomyces astaci]